jgi:hypothetical protein
MAELMTPQSVLRGTERYPKGPSCRSSRLHVRLLASLCYKSARNRRQWQDVLPLALKEPPLLAVLLSRLFSLAAAVQVIPERWGHRAVMI